VAYEHGFDELFMRQANLVDFEALRLAGVQVDGKGSQSKKQDCRYARISTCSTCRIIEVEAVATVVDLMGAELVLLVGVELAVVEAHQWDNATYAAARNIRPGIVHEDTHLLAVVAKMIPTTRELPLQEEHQVRQEEH